MQQLPDDPLVQIKEYRKTRDYLVAIDTDGCVVDNMNGKQMLIFHPLFMEFYDLWDVESYFREIAEYYNLFSAYRGANRFVTICLTLKALESRQDVKKIVEEKNLKIPDAEIVEDFIKFCEKDGSGLSNFSLRKFIKTRPMDFCIRKLLGWSEAVNETLPIVNRMFEPFENVGRCLELMSVYADIAVVSQTPYDDLFQYWHNHNMTRYLKIICGQETGSKAYQISMLKQTGGYSDDNVLVIGDSNGDFEAARMNNIRFYPVIPGKEEQAWKNFPEVFELFLHKGYTIDIEEKFLSDFRESLSDIPPWKKGGYNHTDSYRKNQQLRKSLYQRFNPDGRLLIL